MKHRKWDPGSGISSCCSNISRAMQGRIPKFPNFLAIRNQSIQNDLVLLTQSAPPLALQQVEPTSTTQGKRTSDRNRRSLSYYGFDNSSSDATIAASPKRPRQAGDVENFQTLDKLSKQYRTLPFNSLKKSESLRLSEKFRNLISQCYRLLIRIPRHWRDRWQSLKMKIMRCPKRQLHKPNHINCKLLI